LDFAANVDGVAADLQRNSQFEVNRAVPARFRVLDVVLAFNNESITSKALFE
jgi:hypothetical protein